MFNIRYPFLTLIYIEEPYLGDDDMLRERIECKFARLEKYLEDDTV